MKTVLIYFLLFFNLFVFSQEIKIKKAEFLPIDIDFKGHVKSMIITNLIYNKKTTKVDSIRAVSEVHFSKKGKIELAKIYNNFNKNSSKIIELDKLERITKISHNTGESISSPINQYYSNDSDFPDSTLINTYEKYKEKFINIFDGKKVVRQHYFVNDTLKDLRTYKYNSKGQVIEEVYMTPENNTDETLVSTETDNGIMLSFYPERKILYEYEKRKDTIVVIKIRPKYNMKEVTKIIKKTNYDIEIFEKYNNNHLDEKEITTDVKDSISKFHLRYNDKGEVNSYYNKFITPEKITTKYTTYKDEKENIYIIKIDVVYDRFKNWIKKTFIIRDTIDSITERKIDYY